jgi:hypothetical protein
MKVVNQNGVVQVNSNKKVVKPSGYEGRVFTHD